MISRLVAFALVFVVDARPLRADDMEGDAVYVPMPAGESLTVRNPLGDLRVRGWDQPEVRIIAHKRTRQPALLDRLKVRVQLDGGKLDIACGVYLADGVWMPLPLSGAAIDLTIDAPRRMALRATSFGGEIDASGLRAGARLQSQGGEIRVADVRGPVVTRTLAGRQQLQGIQGRLAATGVSGDMELEGIDGDTIDATVYKGHITARELRTPVVRLSTTVGTIVLVGALQPGGRYELATHDGDVRLTLAPSPFRVVARGLLVRSGFDVLAVERAPGLLRGEFQAGGASLQLVSAKGSISIDPRR